MFIVDGKGEISSGNTVMEMVSKTCWWKSMGQFATILEELVDEIANLISPVILSET